MTNLAEPTAGTLQSRAHTSAGRSAKMRAHWRNPEYRARQLEHLKRRGADPEERERLRQIAIVSNAKRGLLLPPMTDGQRLHYRKCRRAGIGRAEALKAALDAAK